MNMQSILIFFIHILSTRNPLTTSNDGRRRISSFYKLFSHLFHRSTTNNVLREDRELARLSTTLIKPDVTNEILASMVVNVHKEDSCLFTDSPHYIVRVSHNCIESSVKKKYRECDRLLE